MKLIATAILSLIAISSAHAQTSCMMEENKLEPYYVMGSLVYPQSDTLVVGDCDKSFEENEQAYINSDKKRPEGIYMPGHERRPSSSSLHCEAHVTGSGGHTYLDSWCVD